MIFQREHLDSSYANTQNRIAAVEIKLSREDVAVFVLMKNEAFILRNLKSETDLLCECYDLLGDYYMLFGMKDIRTAISLSKIAGYHNFKINVDSAILYSSQAYSIYKTNYPKQCDPVTIEIIDEYAYASKIYYGRGKENLDIGVE